MKSAITCSDGSCARPLLRHLGRGLIAALGVVGALWMAPTFPLLAALLGVGAFVVFRGCPMCWMMGFLEIWRDARQQERSKCADVGAGVASRDP